MSGRLDGKTALITGATGGIGTATAELFAREGARLVMVDLDPDALATLSDRLRSAGPAPPAIPLDVASAPAWAEAAATVQEQFGELHVLVNLAGILDWPGIEDTREEAWDRNSRQRRESAGSTVAQTVAPAGLLGGQAGRRRR